MKTHFSMVIVTLTLLLPRKIFYYLNRPDLDQKNTWTRELEEYYLEKWEGKERVQKAHGWVFIEFHTL